MKVKFWGTRGSIPVPGDQTTVYGGNTTCLEITLGKGRTVIVDSGTGIRPLGRKLMEENNISQLYLFITHIHWDHILGFPFFNPIYDSSSKIFVDGHPNCLKGLKYTFNNKMGDGFFPIEFKDLKAEITYMKTLSKKEPLTIDDTLIESISLNHPQGCYGLRFTEDGKRMVFMTDNELEKNSQDKDREFDKCVEFCRNADVLIHDAQYTPEEIKKCRGWGHSDFRTTCELAKMANVRRLILFHHDPPRIDTELTAIEKSCRDIVGKSGSDMTIEAAREGNEFSL